MPLLNMLVTGKARPYLHNGIMAVNGDDLDVGQTFCFCLTIQYALLLLLDTEI